MVLRVEVLEGVPGGWRQLWREKGFLCGVRRLLRRVCRVAGVTVRAGKAWTALTRLDPWGTRALAARHPNNPNTVNPTPPPGR